MNPTDAIRGLIPVRVLANHISIPLLALALGVSISACGPSEVGEGDAAAGETSQPTGGGGGGDITPPDILSLLPASGSRIAGTRKITITFNESIKRSTLRLRGDLEPESDGGKWSQTTFKNDTLTIAPIVTWNEGDERTLTLNVKDPKGNALGKAVLTYTVDLTDPVGSVWPESGAVIGGATPIVITFDGAMRTSLMVLDGDLIVDSDDIEVSDGGVWSETTVPKDTLTISPLTAWTEGEARGLTVDGEDLAGNLLETLALAYTVDTTAPVGSASPASGSFIQVTDTIIVTFDEAMDTASLILAGGMVEESDGGAWSLAVDENDTLTITPLTEWTEANGKTLSIDAADIAGNAVTTLELTYTVDLTAPVGSVSPAAGVIRSDAAIVVTFNEAMDATSETVTLDMDIFTSTGTVTWGDSGAGAVNDQLTIPAPDGGWAADAATGTIQVTADDLAGNASDTGVLTYTVDDTAATVGANYPSDSDTIDEESQIVFIFSESMDTGTGTVTGTLGGGTPVVAWSTTTNANDTATITPTAAWSGTGASIGLDADDVAGNTTSASLTNITASASGAGLVSVTPGDGAILGTNTTPIVIVYDSAMPNVLADLNGSLATEANAGDWDTVTNTFDQLTISPAGSWTTNANASLIIEVEDAGSIVTVTSLTYDVP